MRRLATILLAGVLVSCRADEPTALQVEALTNYCEEGQPCPPPFLPTYFGFYDVGHDDAPGLANVSNIARTWIGRSGENLCNGPLHTGNLESLVANGFKVILVVAVVFYDCNLDRLRPDYADQWAALASLIAPHVASGAIVAFEPVDEPYDNISYTYLDPTPISPADAKSDMETIALTIKSTFPGAAMYITYGDASRWRLGESGAPVPSYYDWFSINCYGDWSNCGVSAYVDCQGNWQANCAAYGMSMASMLTTLRIKTTQVNPSAKTVIVGDHYGCYSNNGGPKSNEGTYARTLKDIEYATHNSFVVGVLTYTWATFGNCTTVQGSASTSAWGDFGVRVEQGYW